MLYQKSIFRYTLTDGKLYEIRMGRGLFWEKLMFYSLFISILVNTISGLILFDHTSYYLIVNQL